MNGEPARSTYVDALWQSFFSRSLYLDVARHWRGLGFLYLLLIVVLGWLPDLAKLQMGVQTLHGESAESFIRQIPVIDIRDGTATANVETPYFIKNPKNGKVLAIIDFSGQYTTLDNTSAVVLLTRHEVVTRRSGREVRAYSLAGVKQFTIDQVRLRHWLHLIVTWFVVLITPFVVAFAFAFHICQALFYAGLGMAFANGYHVKLGFNSLLRIACVALTPVIMLSALTDLWRASPPFPRLLLWLIHIAITVWYVSFGVKACATEAVEQPLAPVT